MESEDIEELHFITLIGNVRSILSRGILCHDLAHKLKPPPGTIDLLDVQEKRSKKKIPGGLSLHAYANLYLHARNPMLYKRKMQHGELCVLRIHKKALKLEGAIISDGNAASEYVAFYPSPLGLENLDKRLVLAEYWTDERDEIIEGWRRKSARCAELLIPEKADPSLIVGAYVSCDSALEALKTKAPKLRIEIDRHLFFM